MAVDVPPEIWLHIAHFIPDKCLRDMFAVNRVFFHLAMDVRYQDILIKVLDNDALRTVCRLSDPSVASRVQSLDLQLNLAEKHPLAFPSIAPRRMLKTWKATLFPHRRGSSPKHAPKPYEAFIARLSAVLPLMTNLQAFTAKVWNWPIQDLNHFLTMAWSSFRRNLRKLSVGGSLDAFLVLPPSNLIFDSLRELDFEFTSSPGMTDNYSHVLVENIAPFVNNLAPQLLALRVWSIAFADLSPFFKCLTLFPLLETFAIRAAFDRSFSEDPSGLTRLLHNSSTTLKAVQLRLNPSGLFHHPNSDERLSAWLLHTFANDAPLASGLHTLQLYPSSSDTGIDTLVLCLERSSQSLKIVAVYDRYLTYPEARRIVAALPSQLAYLRLNISELSSTILNLLAKCLPNLTNLTLHIGTISDDFKLEISQRTYANWKLEDLNIWQGGNQLDSETMHVLGNCIPSLTSFWGRGHK